MKNIAIRFQRIAKSLWRHAYQKYIYFIEMWGKQFSIWSKEHYIYTTLNEGPVLAMNLKPFNQETSNMFKMKTLPSGLVAQTHFGIDIQKHLIKKLAMSATDSQKKIFTRFYKCHLVISRIQGRSQNTKRQAILRIWDFKDTGVGQDHCILGYIPCTLPQSIIGPGYNYRPHCARVCMQTSMSRKKRKLNPNDLRFQHSCLKASETQQSKIPACKCKLTMNVISMVQAKERNRNPVQLCLVIEICYETTLIGKVVTGHDLQRRCVHKYTLR